MDAASLPELTVADHMPWLGMTLDYTDEIAALIPEDKLDWRPVDPSGKFCFSLAEIAMHCADTRRMFARQLAGDEGEDGYFSEGDGPGDDGVWKFKATPSRQAIVDSLKSARAELEAFYGQPVSRLLDVTDGSRRGFEKNIKNMQEKGADTTQAERRGPPSMMRVLMAVAVHEAGHRGALQTLLRQQGINAKGHE